MENQEKESVEANKAEKDNISEKEVAKTDSSLQDSNAADKDGERTGSPAGNATPGPLEGNAVDSQQNNENDSQQNTGADNMDSGKGSVCSEGDNQGSGEGDIGTEDTSRGASSKQGDHKDNNGESDVVTQRGNEGSTVESEASVNPQGANATPQEGEIEDNTEQREEILSPPEGTNKETKDDTSSTTNVKEDQHQAKDKAVKQQTKKGDDPALLVTTETSEDTETDRDKDTVTSDTANEDTTGRSPSSRARNKSQSSHSRRKERRKKKHSSPAPKLRKKTSKVGNAAEHYLQSILLSYFQAFDQSNIGLVSHDDFWNIILSAELNLQLNQIDIQMIQNNLPLNEQGFVVYMEFIGVAQQLITSIYNSQPDTESNWVDLRGYGGVIVRYNKKSGEIIDNADAGMDMVFEVTMRDIFTQADKENKGFITLEQFNNVLKTKDFNLNPNDKEEIAKLFPEGSVSYSDFQPIAREVILRTYRAKTDSDNEWSQITSPRVGTFWLNLVTGETRRNPPITGEGAEEAAFINQAYTQIESLTLQLEQERVRTRELENRVAITNEELEAMATQLDDTGRNLDETNLELQLRETEVSQLQSIISEKDMHLDDLTAQVATVTAVEDQLKVARLELDNMKRLLQNKEAQLAGRDQTIDDLKLQSGDIVEELKNAHGVIDAKDSSIGSLQYNLTNEQGRIKELNKQMPSLETRLSLVMNELVTNKRSLEEKTAILLQTRESLKKARAKNTELERDNSRLSDVNAKLKNAECEVRTLKSFLTSKTAMVEKRKKEIQELKLKISEIESRDGRRAVILADVLEKTARTLQHQLTSPRQYRVPTEGATEDVPKRPLSAPLTHLEELLGGREQDPLSMSYQAPSQQTHLLPGIKMSDKSPRKRHGHIKARTVPRLPPIRKTKSNFVIPAQNEVKRFVKDRDKQIKAHITGANCQCKMCIVNKRSPAVEDSFAERGGALARLKQEEREKEYMLSKQLKMGQRVLIQIKKTAFDLEPQKLTGTIKYVGKVDSEYIDNRIYVGVKLDDPVGNTDGLYKGRRYFTCPPSHGRMVRITSVIAVMPNRGLTYVPLQITSSTTNNATTQYNPFTVGPAQYTLQVT